MTLSHIDLNHPDPERLWFDPNAKSVAFFCLKRPVCVDDKVIEDLKKLSAKHGDANARICLHAGPESNHHDMVILEHRGKYYRPHKHADKGEAFHIMEGSLGVFAFDDAGTIIDARVLDPGSIYRVEAGMYHAVLPLSAQVIYHENKPGPFIGEGDSLFADWSPSGKSDQENNEFVESIRKHLPD